MTEHLPRSPRRKEVQLSLRLGYTNIAKQLVEKGAVVDLRDAEDNTVLMRMIRNGKFMDSFANIKIA